MIQYDAINTILTSMVNSNLINGCFLKGSLARQEEDNFANIDMYCIIKDENLMNFFDYIYDVLESYNSILYLSNKKNGCEQIICVFDNGLRLNLFLITKDQIDYNGNILVLYDPDKIINISLVKTLSLTPVEVGQIFDSFSLKVLDFYNSYKRDDLPYTCRIASHLFYDYSCILRYFTDNNMSKIGIKGFIFKMSKNEQNKYLYIQKLIKCDTILLSVQSMTVEMSDLITKISIETASNFNYDLFMYIKKLIFSI